MISHPFRSKFSPLDYSRIFEDISGYLNGFKKRKNNLRFFEEMPLRQSYLTKYVCESSSICWGNYQQNTLSTFRPNDFFDSTHGILNFLATNSHNGVDFNEIEFHYSGARFRKDINHLDPNANILDNCDVLNIFDFSNTRTFFIVPRIANAFFGITFKRIKVMPLFYTIQSDVYPRTTHLMHWVFEGYDIEQDDWIILDERVNTNAITLGKFATFCCINTNKSFSSFRIRQTNQDEQNDWGFSFSAFEIHGHVSLIDEPPKGQFEFDLTSDMSIDTLFSNDLYDITKDLSTMEIDI